MAGCEICGGRFAEHKCLFCGRTACSSCVAVESGRCRKCAANRVPLSRFVRQNKILFIFLGTIWIYTVYPYPFLYAIGFDVDMTVLQPILITTLVLAIPFIFMLRAWQKRPPR